MSKEQQTTKGAMHVWNQRQSDDITAFVSDAHNMQLPKGVQMSQKITQIKVGYTWQFSDQRWDDKYQRLKPARSKAQFCSK
jgi:hypothetical protein